MKKIFIMYANYLRKTNEIIYSLLNGLSNDQREKDQGSYYKSLSGLLRHIVFGTKFFLGLYKSGLKPDCAASKVIDKLENQQLPDGALTEAQWQDFKTIMSHTDTTLVDFISALDETEFNAPIKIEWYQGKPDAVPLAFMLNQLIAHGIHHQGQVSQILDELKIDNNYSGIGIEFLPVN